MARTTGRRRNVGGTQWVALSLLLLFLAGFSFTTFTHDWLGSLPYHDHILMGALGVNHHAHRGDPLDHALSSLHTVGTAGPILTHEEATARAEARANTPGVLSLQPLTGLQPEINSYTAAGLLAATILLRVAARGRRLPTEPTLFASGQAYAPLFPPPRYA